MQLADILVLNHLGTKKQVKKLIRNKKISLNGQIIDQNIEISEGCLKYQETVLDIHPLKYVMINKPVGYVCDASSPQAIDQLIKMKGLSYVGRLDRDTSGLLLMTNDFKCRKKLILPEYHVPKTYAFTCARQLTHDDLISFKKGIIIDGHVQCRPADVKLDNPYCGEITIDEGKYHEIRKMFLSLNNQIVSLKRIAFGPIRLSSLEEGQYRFLKEEEIRCLKESINECS